MLICARSFKSGFPVYCFNVKLLKSISWWLQKLSSKVLWHVSCKVTSPLTLKDELDWLHCKKKNQAATWTSHYQTRGFQSFLPHSESDFQFKADGIVIYAASSCMDVEKCWNNPKHTWSIAILIRKSETWESWQPLEIKWANSVSRLQKAINLYFFERLKMFSCCKCQRMDNC